MRLNIGPDKSAAMIINDYGLNIAINQWHIGGTPLPIVHKYKYLGQALQDTGRWDEWLKTVVHRTKHRTSELVRWARSNHITIDILARLWIIYVEKAAGWGLAATTLTPTQSKAIDRAQRMAARQILGHSSTSPWPTPCLELGWQTWSSQMASQKMRLYQRLLTTENTILKAILAKSRSIPDVWVSSTELQTNAAFPAGLPTQATKWLRMLHQWEAVQKQSDTEELIYNSKRHPNLAHYSPNTVPQANGQGTNQMIHHHSYSVKSAITISRLLCGGQGLNAGDPVRPSEVCMRKACKFCLSLGQPKAETLWHFLHECPLTATARQGKEAKQCWSQPENVAKLHLSIWSSKQIRTIRITLSRMWHLRQSFNSALAADNSISPKDSRTAGN